MADNIVRPIGVIGGVRTPFCRSNTLYADLTNLDLFGTALAGLINRYDLKGVHIDEVVGGAVVTHAKDWNLAREAVIASDLAPTTPGVTMMQACGTSLQAAMGIGAKIASGQIECGIAAGSDTVSDAPIVFQRRFAQRLIALSKAKTWRDKLKVFSGFTPGELAPQPPKTAEPRTGLTMGQHCELMAQSWGISREAQDKIAYESHKKAAAAYDIGYMEDLLIPCGGVFKDNNLRPDIELTKIATLKNAFEKSPRGTLSAANSTPLTDGASAVLLSSDEWAQQRGLKIKAYITHSEHIANNYVEGEGLLMAPTIAVGRMLKKAGLSLQDFDYYEIHEAFAAQLLCTLKAWEDEDYCQKHLGQPALGSIDQEKLNIHGSSIAFGHPFAATGGRIIATLAKTLEQKGSGRGLISICTAGGMGVAAIMEAA